MNFKQIAMAGLAVRPLSWVIWRPDLTNPQETLGKMTVLPGFCATK